jgi:hypothetical protein
VRTKQAEWPGPRGVDLRDLLPPKPGSVGAPASVRSTAHAAAADELQELAASLADLHDDLAAMPRFASLPAVVPADLAAPPPRRHRPIR